MAKDIRFPEHEPQWVFDRDCVQFLALVDRKPVRCLVSIESLVLEYHIGYSRREALQAFQENKRTIQTIAGRLLESGQYDEGRGELLLKTATLSTNTTSPPRLPISDAVKYSEDVQANPRLYEELQRASATLTRFLGKVSDETQLTWKLEDPSSPSVVELLIDDPEIDMQFRDWYSVDDLAKPDFMTRQMSRLVGSWLHARNHKLLEQIQSGSEE